MRLCATGERRGGRWDGGKDIHSQRCLVFTDNGTGMTSFRCLALGKPIPNDTKHTITDQGYGVPCIYSPDWLAALMGGMAGGVGRVLDVAGQWKIVEFRI